MARTPDPTDEQFLDELPSADQRVTVGIRELVRRLEDNIPDKIDAVNEELNLSIPKPAGYGVAPLKLTDKHLNQVLVGFAPASNAFSPGVFQNKVQLVIYILDERAVTEVQVYDAFERAGIVHGILYHFLNGCVDGSERQAWRLLEQGNTTFLPAGYGDGYSGVACYYTMTQDPSKNNWIPDVAEP